MEPTSGINLISAINGTLQEPRAADFVFNNVSIDSRTIQTGDLFWAITGERFDGHNFVDVATAHGAVACVVHREINRVATGGRPPVIMVDNTQNALWNFASWYRRQLDALAVGVTGSFGKTTTREMIYSALSHEHRGIRSAGNLNNHLGVPLSILQMEKSHDYAVLELGASAVGEIAELTNLAKPEVGVITGIGPAHLQGFGSIEGIIQGKGELLEGLPHSGFAVIPGDDPKTRGMAERANCPVIFVGIESDNDIRAEQIHWSRHGLEFSVESTDFLIPIAGRHFVIPALSAIAIGREIGMSLTSLAEGLRSFQPVTGRCQIHAIGPWSVIHDAYNANPASMTAACRMLAEWPGGNRKFLFVGDMLELGDDSSKYHAELGREIAHAGLDGLLAWGTWSDDVIDAAKRSGMSSHALASAEDWEVLLTVLDCWLEPGDVILIKGSRGMHMERVLDWLQIKAREFEKSLQLPRRCA